MQGKNWNSKRGEFTDIVNESTINKAKKAQNLKTKGYSVKKISEIIGVSTGRIYEYLRE